MSSTPNPPQVPDPTAQGAETPAVPEDAAPVASGPAEGALPAQGSDGDWEKKFNRLERRAKRDRTARAEAEKLLEDKAAELYAAKQNLEKLLQERDQEVEKRTRQLKTARDDLAQALSERTQYFSSISHEIRTPLNMVPELIGQISEATTDRMTLDHCTIIERAIQDVLDTLTGFILLSDNNQLGERDPETLFDLPDLVDHACSIDRHRAEQKGIAFQIDLPQDFERAFWGHPHLLQTALRQLTANAADHTKTGHIKVSVSGAVTEERPSMIHFQVQDSGSGLDPKMARDRLSGNTTLRPGIGGTGAGGIGVGLPLVARLVRSLDGVIGFESEPGRGTDIWFSIPLRAHAYPARYVIFNRPDPAAPASSADRQAVPSPETTQTAAQTTDPSGAPGRTGTDLAANVGTSETGLLRATEAAMTAAGLSNEGKAPGGAGAQAADPTMPRVLLAEDDPIAAEIGKRMLAAISCDVTHVSDGQQAYDLLQGGGFDLVFLDVNMPGITGPEIARRLRAKRAAGTPDSARTSGVTSGGTSGTSGTSGQSAPLTAATAPLPYRLIALSADADEARQGDGEALFDAILQKPLTKRMLVTMMAQFQG